MKRTAGFTLIELVIVIVILGILGAVAAPRFLNLQGDAYGANLNALKSSMESASTLVNTKAILAGVDKKDDGKIDAKKAGVTVSEDAKGEIALVYGYPAATADGIIAVLEGKYAATGDADADAAAAAEYLHGDGGETIIVYPKARGESCSVTYTNATKGQRPEITIDNRGC